MHYLEKVAEFYQQILVGVALFLNRKNASTEEQLLLKEAGTSTCKRRSQISTHSPIAFSGQRKTREYIRPTTRKQLQ